MGANIDKSLSFGIQNFFFVQSDETDGTYNYYGYQNRKGTILIMKTNKTTSVALWYATLGVFATVWAGKADYSYVVPSSLNDQSIN